MIGFTPSYHVRTQDYYDTCDHFELTGVTSGSTAEVTLDGERFFHRVICEGANDIVYMVVDSSDASTDLGDSTKRHKLIATTTGYENRIAFKASKLAFRVKGSNTVNIYVDSYI